MIKLLVVSGSPVKDSSTDILLRETAAVTGARLEVKGGVETTFVKLNDLKFTSCQACGKAPTPKWCFYDDDLDSVYPLVAECDCLLFGSPVYFDSVSGQAKMFIDRCNCFRPYDFANHGAEFDFIKMLKRQRPGGIVLVGGDEIGMEGARRTIAGFFKWIEVVNCGVVKYSSSNDRKSGTVRDDDNALGMARTLGERLATAVMEGC